MNPPVATVTFLRVPTDSSTAYAAPSLLHYLRPDVLVAELVRFRDLLRQFIWRGVQERYQGSFLGILWALLTPLAMLAVYTFVFAFIFGVEGNDRPTPNRTVNYTLMLFTGLIVFQVFSECATAAPGLIVRNTNYVKKVVFPLEILPISSVGAAVVHSLISLAIVLLAVLALTRRLPLTVLYLPLYYLPLVAFMLGLSWVLASLGVFLRDIGHLMVVIVQLLMFLTPIFYSIDLVGRNHPNLLPYYRLNPLTILVEGFRRNVLFGQAPEWTAWAITTVASVLFMLAGYAWFMKIKRAFADVI